MCREGQLRGKEWLLAGVIGYKAGPFQALHIWAGQIKVSITTIMNSFTLTLTLIRPGSSKKNLEILKALQLKKV